jgi:hypothetical protein
MSTPETKDTITGTRQANAYDDVRTDGVRGELRMDSKLLVFLLDAFIASYEQEVAVTRNVMLAVPEQQKTYKPDSRSMTAEELVWHIASDEVWFQKSVLEGKFERGNYKSHPSTICAK